LSMGKFSILFWKCFPNFLSIGLNIFHLRWGIDENLYTRAIENHMRYLKHILKHHREDVHAHLRRSILIVKLQK